MSHAATTGGSLLRVTGDNFGAVACPVHVTLAVTGVALVAHSFNLTVPCLLSTSEAADDLTTLDLVA